MHLLAHANRYKSFFHNTTNLLVISSSFSTFLFNFAYTTYYSTLRHILPIKKQQIKTGKTMLNSLKSTLLLFCIGGLFSLPAYPQGTVEDYNRAYSLREKYNPRHVLYSNVVPHWVEKKILMFSGTSVTQPEARNTSRLTPNNPNAPPCSTRKN